MTKKTLLLLLHVFIIFSISCKSKTQAQEQVQTKVYDSTCTSVCGKCITNDSLKFYSNDSTITEVLYFHATRRCATCEAVEKETKETLVEVFGEEVPFTSINREESENKAMVEKYGISGQTLLLIKGDSVVNFTNTAFMLARTDAEKYKTKLLEKLKSLSDN